MCLLLIDIPAQYCYGYIDFSLHFLFLSFPLSFYHLFISIKSKSPFFIPTIHFLQLWQPFYELKLEDAARIHVEPWFNCDRMTKHPDFAISGISRLFKRSASTQC